MSQTFRMDATTANALLKEKLLHMLTEAGKQQTAIEGLALARYHQANYLENSFYKPLLGVIVQGGKRSLIGSEKYEYGENQSLVVGVDVPSAYYVTGATPDNPFLGASLELDRTLLAQLAATLPPPPGRGSAKGVAVADSDPQILDAFLRLLDLLDRPEQIPVLAPMIIREIHYRLLTGPQGESVRMLNTPGTPLNQISRAVTWMRSNYRETLEVDKLARRVNMATSTFHHHFKKVTTLSPLQFHKRLRLYEAKRLMLEERETAGGASLAVGYESHAQFTREYKQLFGNPPLRDIGLLQM